MLSLASEELLRIKAVSRSGLLDGLLNPVLEDLVALASQICQTPVALITILDGENQWFKSAVGITLRSTGRDVAFCNYTIQGKDLMMVPDSLLDPRFVNNPLVTHDPNIRFYAGFPIFTCDGFALGTLCVIDYEPRDLSILQLDSLRRLARYAEAEIERKRVASLLSISNLQLCEEIERRCQVEKILRDVINIQSKTAHSQMEPEAVLQLLVDHVQLLTESKVLLDFTDTEGQFYRVAAEAKLEVPEADISGKDDAPITRLGSGIQSRLDNSAEVVAEVQLQRKNNSPSLLIHPISEEAAERGSFRLWSKKPDVFDPRHKQVLETLACFIVPLLNQASDRKARKAIAKERDGVLAALKEREQLFEAFMNHNPAAAFMKDADGRMLFINSTIKKIWNVTDPDWLGKTDAELWPADVVEKLRTTDGEVLRTGRPTDVIEEIPLPNGELRLFHSFKFPFRDKQGRLLVGGMSFDVTESRQTEAKLRAALAAKDALIKAVHHRVNNNLQVISSLLSLQERGVSDENMKALLRHNKSRVGAMALVHEELYRSADLSSISMNKYLEQVLRYQTSIYSSRDSGVHVLFESTDDVRVSADYAIPCGLIVNELVSNSFKHAFLGLPGSIRLVLERGEKRFTIRVHDTGIGLPKGFVLGATKSLGLEIVQILTRQIHGTLEINGNCGTLVELTVPWAAEDSAGSDQTLTKTAR